MKSEEQPLTVSLADIRAFIAYAMIDVLIAIGMYEVAPEGLGQLLGVAFALALVPLPAIVLYFTRWRKFWLAITPKPSAH